MKIRVLGCAGSVSTESKTSAFLINNNILLDGGSICSTLTFAEIHALKNIFITHPHFDHIQGIPPLAENLIFMQERVPLVIHGSEPTIAALREHILNGVIWPDFATLPTEANPVIKYDVLAIKVPTIIDSISITPYLLCRNTSDFGFLIENGKTSLLYTSDIGPDADLYLDGRTPDAMIIEVSFPNEKEELALETGHLTPLLMLDMLKRLPSLPRTIYISHMKTYFRVQIVAQLAALGLANLVVLNDGDYLEL